MGELCAKWQLWHAHSQGKKSLQMSWYGLSVPLGNVSATKENIEESDVKILPAAAYGTREEAKL